MNGIVGTHNHTNTNIQAHIHSHAPLQQVASVMSDSCWLFNLKLLMFFTKNVFMKSKQPTFKIVLEKHQQRYTHYAKMYFIKKSV